MASTTFTTGTPITSAWLQDINTLTYSIFSGLSAIPSSGKVLRSNGTSIIGSTSTFADTYSVSTLLYASSANTITGLATANSAVLTTSAGGVPTWDTSTYYKLGGTDVAIADGGTGASTASTGLANLGGQPLATLTTKGDIYAATASATVTRLGVGSDGQVHAADSSQPTGLVYVDNPSRPNLLINPNWQIDQINEGALYTVNTTAVRGPDGWSGDAVGAGVFKLRTLADPENAALKCLEITCTTADASIASTDTYSIYTAIEGYDATSLMIGTSSAQTVTIQFKFKTNITGVYGISLANSAKNRSYYGIITVADTSEHEYSLSLTMDSSGTWLYTNGVGLYLRLTLSAGSNFQGTAGAWAGDAKTTTSAQCNFMSSTSNIAYLKRIQLIPGALVQAYRPADIQKELVRVQRQYAKSFVQGTAPAQAVGVIGASYAAGYVVGNQVAFYSPLKTEMRATPTIVTYNPISANAEARNTDNNLDATSTGDHNSSSRAVNISCSSNGAGGPTAAHAIHWTANARLS